MTIQEEVIGLVRSALKRFGHITPPGATDEQIREFERRSNTIVPEEMQEWLRLFNGPKVGPHGICGIHPVAEYLDIERLYRSYPYWQEVGWIPIAGDGCGDYYVLDTQCLVGSAHPIYFIDHGVDIYTPEYIAASDLWHFLRFLLHDEEPDNESPKGGSEHNSPHATDSAQIDGPNSYWPFDRDRVLAEDPALSFYSGDVPLPWENDTIGQIPAEISVDEKPWMTLEAGRAVYGVAFSPCGSLLGACGITKSLKPTTLLKLWDTQSFTLQHTFPESIGEIKHIAFSPDGQQLASAGGKAGVVSGSEKSGELLLWDPDTGLLKKALEGHTELVTAVAFQLQNSILASSGLDGLVNLWDSENGPLIRTLAKKNRSVQSLAFSPDGRILAIGGSITKARDRLIADLELCDPLTGKTLRTIPVKTDAIGAVSFSPDGQLLATGNGDYWKPGTAELWDPITGELKAVLSGHSRFVTSVAFSHDGLRLATSSVDNTIMLWRMPDGKLERILCAHKSGQSSGVMCVAFSPDGKMLASADDRTVRLWEV